METTVEEGESKPKIVPKFQENLEEGGEDRISALPDCLLLEILSRLPSTKEAIRTGTLSKRWEHLWTLLPTLIFTKYNDNPPWSNFVSFIDKTLTKCRQLKLKKFKLHTRSYDIIGFESKVNSWIRYAIRCNVEELDLVLWNWKCTFRLDNSLFSSSCFTDLRLSGCILNPIAEVNWKNLRILYISKGKLDEDLIEKVLSGSPLLETLVLDDCDGYQMLNITSKSLKKLVFCGHMCPDISYYDMGFVSQVQVNNWIRFAIRCNIEELEIEVWNTDSVAEYQLDQILFTGSCFTDLELDCFVLKPTGVISWTNLRNLCIINGKIDEELIENILCGSPQLETLTLDNCYGYGRLDITSKSVKNLVLSGYLNPDDEDGAHIVEINAPNILSLTIKSNLYLWKLVLVNVSSLVKANLSYEKDGHSETTYEEAEEEMLKGFILNLLHVKELKTGLFCSGVVSRLEAKGFVFPSNVRLFTFD